MSENKQHGWRLGSIAPRLIIVAALTAIVVVAVRDHGASPAAVEASADPVMTLETRTRNKPDDLEAWTRLASGYFDLERFDDAVGAYGSALKLAPRKAQLWSARGEARVMASSHDPMPAAAVADFETAVAIDPKDPRARYFLAVGKDLAGDHKGAIADWLALLADTPKGAVWEADLRRTIEQVGKINHIPVASQLALARQPAPPSGQAIPAIPGPSAADLTRASAIPPSRQREMASAMVERLEARLRDDPGNVEGWMMLIRSRIALEQPDRARTALASAIKANPGQAAQLREQATTLGLR